MYLSRSGDLGDNLDCLKCALSYLYVKQDPPQRWVTFVDFWLELMMILMFLTGAGVLDDISDGLHMF